MILIIILPFVACLVSFFTSNFVLLVSNSVCVITAGVFIFFANLANKNGNREGGLISEILFIYFAVWSFLFTIIHFIWKLLGG